MSQAQRIEAPASAPSIVPDMSRPWVSIDFETANKDKRSACQVAVVRVEGGEIVAERSYLIKPPADVGAWCFTHIHGLSAHSVVAAQGWRGVWSNVEPLFHGVGFVVAHNASFDKGVLEACHAFNQLKPLTIDWHCTVKIGRKVWPEMTTHNLGALAAKLGIQLQHHEALSDAKACARILIAASKVPITAKVSTPQKKAEAPGQMRLDGSVDEIKIESTSPPEEPEIEAVEPVLPAAVQAEKIEKPVHARSVETFPGVRMIMPPWLVMEAWPSGGITFTCSHCNVLEHCHGYTGNQFHGLLITTFRRHLGCAPVAVTSVSDASPISTLPKSDASVVEPVAIESEQSASSEGTAEIGGTSDVFEASIESNVEPASNVSGVQLSAQQIAFFQALRGETGNVALEARAGTGKTFSLVEALNGGHTGVDNALFLAFNASIAAELKDRAPAWVDVSTFNALGKRLMAQKFGANVVEQRKECRILGEILTELDDASRAWWSRSRQFSIVGIVKKVFEGVDKITAALPAIIRPVVVEELPRDSYLGELERMESDRAALANAYTEMAKEILTRMWKDVTRLTFGEQLWSCFQRKLFKPSWPLILIDEAQDLNPLQMAVVQQLAAEGGRVVIVGDPRQAIYAWRGAHAKAFSALVEGLNAKVLPLTVTRRCGRKIVELAQRVVPDFSCPDDVHEGSIESVSLDRALELVRPGDMIVSRSNASLVRTCLRMLKAERHAVIVGRDIAQSLSAIPEMAPKCSDLMSLHKAIDAKYEFRIKLAEERGDRVDELDDERACVLAIVQASGSIQEAVERVQKLSASSSDDSRDPSVVRLMTTHKAKGLEADRVFVLAWTYRLSPARSGADTKPLFAKKGQPIPSPDRALEEENLWYVAITRAKRELVLVRDPSGEAPNSLANRSAR